MAHAAGIISSHAGDRLLSRSRGCTPASRGSRGKNFGFWTDCSAQGPKGTRNPTRRWWCVRKCRDCRRNGAWTCTLQVPSRIRSAVRIAAKSVRFRTHRELKGVVGISQSSRMRDQQGTECFGWNRLRSESRLETRSALMIEKCIRMLVKLPLGVGLSSALSSSFDCYHEYR